MTNPQKIVIAALSLVAITILAGLGCAIAYLFLGSTALPDTEPEIIARQAPAALAEAPLTPTATPQTTTSLPPTATPEPTATGTRVVTVTVPPTPTPTRANCEDDINNFEASGLITNEQVQDYLRRTIPLDHLENCREIRYIPQQAAAHGTAISGTFIPVYREIYVYANTASLRGVDDLLDTLVHEVGHNVHYNIRRDNFALDVEWSALYQDSLKTYRETGMGFVSTYAQTNKYEDFAETYMAYVRAPEILKYYNLNKYEFMRQHIFNGFEYEP